MPTGIIFNGMAIFLGGVIGTAIGLMIHLGEKINRGAKWMQKMITKVLPNTKEGLSEQEFDATLVTVIVLFCASGTGIYGSLAEGMSGDASILISKSILDFFTAAIFAANLGFVVSLIAIPQIIIFVMLFLLAGFIYPLTTPAMIADFKAAGGVLMLAIGFPDGPDKNVPYGRYDTCNDRRDATQFSLG